jgi:hypothetical protein
MLAPKVKRYKSLNLGCLGVKLASANNFLEMIIHLINKRFLPPSGPIAVVRR